MKFIKGTAAAVSAFALLATPVVASAAEGRLGSASAKLGQRVAGRSAAATQDASQGAGGFAIPALVALVAVGGLAAAGAFKGSKKKSG